MKLDPRLRTLRRDLLQFARSNLKLKFGQRLSFRLATTSQPQFLADLVETIDEETETPLRDFLQWILDNADAIIGFIMKIIALFENPAVSAEEVQLAIDEVTQAYQLSLATAA